MKFNISSNEGEPTSATVFFGADRFVATKEHPRFGDILAGLRSTKPIADDDIRALFDVTVPLSRHFKHLSERIEFPEWYELFTKKHFEACNRDELHAVAKEFEITGYTKLSKPDLIAELIKVGRRRKRTWPKEG